jgi:hypothetical protein
MGIQSTSCYEMRQRCYGVDNRSHRSCPAKYYHAPASAALRLRSDGVAFTQAADYATSARKSRRAAHVQKVPTYLAGFAPVDRPGRGRPGRRYGPICVYSCFFCGRHFFHSPLRPTTKGSLLIPAAGRHSETGRFTPVTRSKNKVALSFQRHTGVPPLHPDVAMLCWE